ncbi:hypothetical protein C0J52_05190 [Blattella germanica]|nr:hypothetical protein C0J52_05190 [Blattella germanica]
MESSRGGSIRIQHLTAAAAATSGSPADGRSRFPKLDECAHFHYEQVELGPFQVCLYDEELKPLACEDSENKYWHVAVTSQGKTWVLRRSYENFRMLDQQLHRCIYDRKFSGLQELPPENNVPGENQEESIRRLLTEYLSRFSQIAGNLINCGPVLNWLELDNRGRRLLVPDGDNCPINTPAVAAAYSVKRYTAQAGDEISFEESVWWRGKRGFQVGFFPCECVAVIGDKVPRNLQIPGHPVQPTPEQPSKPVLRKHGKLIANAFDEDRVPALYEDEAILQDIHSVASLLKMYFRELPNPLCTYQLYHTFVNAVQSSQEEGYRLLRMRDAVQKLPPPHYRTLEYLMRHLARVAERGHMTGMTPRNVAIVWAPNLLRCKELEVGGVAALQGVGVQAVVTEFLVCYTDLIFCDGLPPLTNIPQPQVTPKRSRPKSLAISTPTKLLSLEEARTRALLSRKRSGTSSKRSPLGWKSFFSKSGRKSSGPPQRKASTPSELGLNQEKAVTESELAQGRRRLRPVKSAESLASGANSCRNSAALDLESQPGNEQSSDHDTLSPGPTSNKSSGHSRSVSHDSYFDHLAETPVHPAVRPTQLTEEVEDHFSSSLDLSEIQLNFDLEESEMRIFSEDETLVSTSVGSGSIMSQASPRMGSAFRTCSKRIPVPRARPEDPLSGCPSTDPSPKKQKTCAAPISPQGSTRSKRSRLEEQLACSATDLRYIDSQSPENQQLLLVQVEIHPHHPYVNIAETKSSPLAGPNESPPNTGTSMSIHTNNTSPSLAEATVSDNESFTLHSSGLPTPDTPLLLYAPLLDDETCSTSSAANTPDYELKLTPSPATPGSAKYHRLGAPSLSPSPTPTPRLTPNLDGENSYENMLAQATQFGGARYENLPEPASNANDSSAHVSKYANLIEMEDSVASAMRESKYENISAASENKDNALLENDVEDSVAAYEPVNAPDEGEHCSGSGCAATAVQRVYQNVPNTQPEEEEHVYEDVQLNTASPNQTPSESDQVSSTDDGEVYQQVKYFRRSIHEVNRLVEDPGTDETQDSSEMCESGATLMEESVTSQEADYALSCESRTVSECEDHRGCMEESEPGSDQICDDISGMELKEDDCEASRFCESVIGSTVLVDDVVVQLRHPKRRTSSERSEHRDGSARASSESPQSSPEHRRSSGTDPNPNRRRFESEIGRDILRERRMKQELEEMRVANQGSDMVTAHVPQKQSSKCNVRELLSKFETSPTTTPDEPNFPSVNTGQTFDFSNQEGSERANMNFDSIAPTMGRKPDSCSVSAESKLGHVFASASPSLSRKEGGFVAETPKLSRRSDPSPHGNSSTALPPCVRARLAKAARNKLANSTALSVSLDEGQFLSSSGQDAGQLVRVQTSPDINDARGHGGMSADSTLEKNKSTSEITGMTAEKTAALAAADLDDPQRRERIERYKEERRLFLREKYRSESFRGERDEILQRLKQKAGKTLSSPTSDEPMDMSRSVTSERVRSNSFRSSGDERERENERLSSTLERARERRFGRTSVSPKDRASSPERGVTHLERRPKRGSEDSDGSRHRRSSTSDKQKFNGSSSSPEKSPVTCVTVRQRLGSDRMTVGVGPMPNSKLVAGDSDRLTTRPRNQHEEQSRPSALRSNKGFVSVMETKRHFSSSDVELRRTTIVGERLTKSHDGSTRRKGSADKSEISHGHPDVSSRGKLGEPDRRPASIPTSSPEHRITNDSPRRKSSTDCPGRQTSPSYCIRAAPW